MTCECDDCDRSPDVELDVLFGVIDPALGELERGGPIKIPSGTILLFLIFCFFSFEFSNSHVLTIRLQK